MCRWRISGVNIHSNGVGRNLGLTLPGLPFFKRRAIHVAHHTPFGTLHGSLACTIGLMLSVQPMGVPTSGRSVGKTDQPRFCVFEQVPGYTRRCCQPKSPRSCSAPVGAWRQFPTKQPLMGPKVIEGVFPFGAITPPVPGVPRSHYGSCARTRRLPEQTEAVVCLRTRSMFLAICSQSAALVALVALSQPSYPVSTWW